MHEYEKPDLFSKSLKHNWLCIGTHHRFNSPNGLITADSSTSMKQELQIFPQHVWKLCLADVRHVRIPERLQNTWSDMPARWSTTSHYSKTTRLGDQGPHHTLYCARPLLHLSERRFSSAQSKFSSHVKRRGVCVFNSHIFKTNSDWFFVMFRE